MPAADQCSTPCAPGAWGTPGCGEAGCVGGGGRGEGQATGWLVVCGGVVVVEVVVGGWVGGWVGGGGGEGRNGRRRRRQYTRSCRVLHCSACGKAPARGPATSPSSGRLGTRGGRPWSATRSGGPCVRSTPPPASWCGVPRRPLPPQPPPPPIVQDIGPSYTEASGMSVAAPASAATRPGRAVPDRWELGQGSVSTRQGALGRPCSAPAALATVPRCEAAGSRTWVGHA